MRTWAGRGEAWPEDFPKAVVEVADAVPGAMIDRWCEERLARAADVMDAHPPDYERIEMARDAKASGLFRWAGPASALFSNFEVLSKQVSALHYQEELGRGGPGQ